VTKAQGKKLLLEKKGKGEATFCRDRADFQQKKTLFMGLGGAFSRKCLERGIRLITGVLVGTRLTRGKTLEGKKNEEPVVFGRCCWGRGVSEGGISGGGKDLYLTLGTRVGQREAQ